MAKLPPLPVDRLRRTVDPALLQFGTTAELEDLAETLGQDRAVDALHFGVGIRRPGYNVFALGPPGAGKHSTLEQYLVQVAAGEPPPVDWVYVHNFDIPHKPCILAVPPGYGLRLRDDMDHWIEELRSAIPAALESQSYQSRRETIAGELKQRQEKALEELRADAEAKKIALLRTPIGLAFAPMRGDEVVEPTEFAKLPEEEQQRVKTEIEALQTRLQEILKQVPQWEREHRQRMRELRREVTKYSVEHLIDDIEKKWADFPEVLEHLQRVERDVLTNTQLFMSSERGGATDGANAVPLAGSSVPPAFRRYQVNVLVDNAETKGAPVIYEDQPSVANLIGRVEHLPQQGALLTDFLLIRPGALHRANGGYLIVDARKLLTQPFSWDMLKRALLAHEVRMEPMSERLGFASTVTLEPEPMPLDVKVVLIGDRFLYYLIRNADPEFEELFKVTAEFDDRMERTEDGVRLYARLIATQARHENMRPFDVGAVGRVIEESSRCAGDAEKLTTRLSSLHDLMRESDYWAGHRGSDVVSVSDVDHAIDAQLRRAGLIRERIREEIRRGTIHVETTGQHVGQVNALAIHEFAGHAFGRPTRITAKVRLGRGEVIDIEREVALGGPLHAKGVLILSGYLGSRYLPSEPLTLSATLVFEQSYGGVDGDSASSAELYALLSALSELPIRQSFAITGSVDQHGNVQAIGGVNEKIEGFFDVCRESGGLTGEQGVLIPATNVKHLMLRRDVVAACAEGRFHVYAVETIDQGIEILTGVPAGERRTDGTFPEGTVNRRVADRLCAFAESARRYMVAGRALGGTDEPLDVVRSSGYEGPTVPNVPEVPNPQHPPKPPMPPVPGPPEPPKPPIPPIPPGPIP